jgi:DNA-binding winged helix-turn-helix (wHTH) protein
MRLRFGDCIFDSGTRQLERGGAAVRLGPKAFRLLELLLERRPQALAKAELQRLIWPDTFVSETNLATLAGEVREAIGDESRKPRFVRTVHGFGYAFSGDAVPADAGAGRPPRRQCIIGSGLEFELDLGENIVGRDEKASVRLDDPTVSRHHAKIVTDGQSAVLEDLGSKNGTFIGGRPVRKPVPLTSGVQLAFGSVQMRYRSFSPDSSTESVRGSSKKRP